MSGGAGGQTVNGSGTIPGGVPVGARVSFSVEAPSGSGYIIDTASIHWSGGTNYRSYFSDDADQAAQATMKVETNVPTNGSSYEFIVKATGGDHYSITVSVDYTNGASGTATMTFDSVAPSVAELTIRSQGKGQLDTLFLPTVLKISDRNSDAGALNPNGIYIEAIDLQVVRFLRCLPVLL